MAWQCASDLTSLVVRLTKQLAGTNACSNLVFSPLSIYSALSLVAAGARGRTLDEVLHVLGARSRDELAEFVGRMAGHTLTDRFGSGRPCVAFTCGVWSDAERPVRPAYRDAIVGTYKAETKPSS